MLSPKETLKKEPLLKEKDLLGGGDYSNIERMTPG